jgi:aminoglycoside phosphotransferase (APT) family kinase protein
VHIDSFVRNEVDARRRDALIGRGICVIDESVGLPFFVYRERNGRIVVATDVMCPERSASYEARIVMAAKVRRLIAHFTREDNRDEQPLHDL